MQIKPAISFYHDTRRALKSGKFPVKIIVTFQIRKGEEVKYKQDPYKTGISLTAAEYKKIFSASVPYELRKTRDELLIQFKRIEFEVEKMTGYVTPGLLRNRLTGAAITVDDQPVTLEVAQLFDWHIKAYDEAGQIGTRDTYKAAKSSLLRYGANGLLLDEITPEWLLGYEKWMLSPIHKQNEESKIMKANTLSTVAIFLRNLRRVFNDAIDRKIISADLYPFGKKGYMIRTEETVKYALNESEKNTLVITEGTRAEERRALFQWMFSYYCHGMNFQDMAHLRAEHIRPDVIVYVRRKTMRTVKNVKPLVIPIRAEVRKILAEYGTHKPYVFGIIDDSMDEATKHRKIKQWYKTTNKWVNSVTGRLGIPFKVNTYNARHTMAKQLIEKGAHLQNIQELLGHTTISTTQIYTKGMNIEKSRELTDLL